MAVGMDVGDKAWILLWGGYVGDITGESYIGIITRVSYTVNIARLLIFSNNITHMPVNPQGHKGA